MLHCHVDRSLAEIFTRERLESLFPERCVSDASEDGTRLLCLLLWKQVQLSRENDPLGARRDFVPAMDAAPMRQWIDRCTKEKSLSAERQLLLFMGQLWFRPPVEHPLKSCVTSLLWKRAHSAMALEQVKTGEEPSARLLYLDTLLRNEFLSHAFPRAMRESLKKRFDSWETDLRANMPTRKGVSEDDLYSLITLPFVHNYARWWE